MRHLQIGDWVIVKKGHNLGLQGEIVDIVEPLDGGAPIALIDVRGIDDVGVGMDRLEKTHRRS